METEPTNMLAKKAADLTVGEELKLGAAVFGITLAVPVALVLALAGFEALRARREAKKSSKTTDNTLVVE